MSVTEKICRHHGNLDFEDIIQPTPSTKYAKCRICKKESGRKTYYKHLDSRLKKAHANREKNREKNMLWARNDRLINKEKYRINNLHGYKNRGYPDRLHEILRLRNLTKEQYDAMIARQKNKCAICKKSETCKDPKNDRIRRLSIDHDHKSNKTRELLCHSCNTAIGKFKENISVMKTAILYLQKHKGFK